MRIGASNDSDPAPGSARSRGNPWRRRISWLPVDAHQGALIALAVISVGLYAGGITARYSLSRGMEIPRASWYRLSGYSLHAGFIFAAVVGLLFPVSYTHLTLPTIYSV